MPSRRFTSARSRVSTVTTSVLPIAAGICAICSGGDADDRRVREQELAIGQRMLGRIAQHHRGLEVRAPGERRQPRRGTMIERDLARARRLEPRIDLRRDPPGDPRVRKRRQRRPFIVGSARDDGGQLRGDGVGDPFGVRRRNPHP